MDHPRTSTLDMVRRVGAAAILAASLLLARRGGAQAPGFVELFGGGRQSGDTPFVGLGIGGFGGMIGLRASGTLGFDGSGDGRAGGMRCPRAPACRGFVDAFDPRFRGRANGNPWTADADLLFAPFRRRHRDAAPLLGFSPYALLGIGALGTVPNGSGVGDRTVATLSYGAGLEHALAGPVGLAIEGRYRQTLDDAHRFDGLGADVRSGWEGRAGLAIAFGTRRGVRGPRDGWGGGRRDGWDGSGDRAPSARSDDGADRASRRVLDAADRLVGTPYYEGGTSPRGFDAPGFARYVYGAAGVTLPRSTRALADAGEPVSTRIASLRPGDLLLFANDVRDDAPIDHVAIYVGRGRIVHASGSSGDVRYDVLGEGERGRWFADHLVAARRVIGASRGGRSPRRYDDRGDTAPAR